jgi:hypothetical protein
MPRLAWILPSKKPKVEFSHVVQLCESTLHDNNDAEAPAAGMCDKRLGGRGARPLQ